MSDPRYLPGGITPECLCEMDGDEPRHHKDCEVHMTESEAGDRFWDAARALAAAWRGSGVVTPATAAMLDAHDRLLRIEARK